MTVIHCPMCFDEYAEDRIDSLTRSLQKSSLVLTGRGPIPRYPIPNPASNPNGRPTKAKVEIPLPQQIRRVLKLRSRSIFLQLYQSQVGRRTNLADHFEKNPFRAPGSLLILRNRCTVDRGGTRS